MLTLDNYIKVVVSNGYMHYSWKECIEKYEVLKEGLRFGLEKLEFYEVAQALVDEVVAINEDKLIFIKVDNLEQFIIDKKEYYSLPDLYLTHSSTGISLQTLLDSVESNI